MRYAILLAMLLLCLPVRGEAWQVVGGGAAGAPSGPVYTDCSTFPTGASFYLTADHASGATYGCTSLTTTVNYAAMDSVSAVLSSTDPGTASPGSAGYVWKGSTTAAALYYTVSSNDLISTSEGYISVDVYITASVGSNYVLMVDSGYDQHYLYLYSDNTLVMLHKGAGGTVTTSLFSSATVPENTWTKIYAKWSVASNLLSVKVGDGPWENDSDADPVTAFSTGETDFRMFRSASGTMYMDNFTIYKTPNP